MKRFLVLMIPMMLAACAQDSAVDGGAAEPLDLDARMAKADPAEGQRLFLYCQACHTLNEGGMNKIGPNLYGFIDRPAASADGFVFSPALTNSGITWDEAALDEWVAGPSVAVPGTTMIFAGIKDANQRADLIAYLKQATTAD